MLLPLGIAQLNRLNLTWQAVDKRIVYRLSPQEAADVPRWGLPEKIHNVISSWKAFMPRSWQAQQLPSWRRQASWP